jgi:hypothetical protein
VTIAATYLTSEGVVFGADSTATISNPIGVVQLLDHAQKVFEIGQESRIGLCCWGAAGYGQVSHRTLAARLSERPGFSTFTVEQAAHSFVPLVMAARGAAQATDLAGYFVGGWDLETHHHNVSGFFFSMARILRLSNYKLAMPGLREFRIFLPAPFMVLIQNCLSGLEMHSLSNSGSSSNSPYRPILTQDSIRPFVTQLRRLLR